VTNAGSLAPIAAVMPFVQSFEAFAKWHLSGKRGARLLITLGYRF